MTMPADFAACTDHDKGRIIARAWQAIGIPAEHCTDELMAEWMAGLRGLSIEQIGNGVEVCKRRRCTATVDQFALLARADVSAPEPAIVPPDGCSETKAESYRNLNLHVRWGPL